MRQTNTPSYRGFHFPSAIISHVIWLYHRFCLSAREVEARLADHGRTVTDETIRRYCRKSYLPMLIRVTHNKAAQVTRGGGIDEVFDTIEGQRQERWRTVDQDGDSIDILVQRRRNKKRSRAHAR